MSAGILLSTAVAQREVDIDDEELEDFVENMAGGEEEDLEGELADVRAEAEASLTPALRKWIEKEIPGFLKQVERHRRAMEAEGDIEALIESYEIQMDLPDWIDELREAKAEAGEALTDELEAVLKQEVPQVVKWVNSNGAEEGAEPMEILEVAIDRCWIRVELAEQAEELRHMREEAAEVFSGEIREIIVAELPSAIELLKRLGGRGVVAADEPWEQIERRMRYYESHFLLAGLGEELLELSDEEGEPGEEDFDQPLEDAARLERFKQCAALNIACELSALRYHDTQDLAESRRIAKTLEVDLGKAFDASMARLREGELKMLERELREIEADEDGVEAGETEELKREIELIRRRITDREKNRDIIIYRRFVELIEGEDPYAWE